MTARIVDYPSLAQALLDFSHRTDVANFQDYFIQFGEYRIYRDIFSRNLGDGVQWMEQALSGAINPVTGLVPIPTGYLALKDAQVSDGNADLFTLLYKDSQWIYSNYPVRMASGLPKYIARDATNFIFGPFPDAGYSIAGTYYGSGTPISVTNPTTWMTSFCPELLLASCMLELQPFLRDGTGAQMWTAMYEAKLTGLIDLDRSERYSAGTMSQ
jgi:hypothetical protein